MSFVLAVEALQEGFDHWVLQEEFTHPLLSARCRSVLDGSVEIVTEHVVVEYFQTLPGCDLQNLICLTINRSIGGMREVTV